MDTFTFISNYKGGTYIRQVEAEDLTAAAYAWAEKLAKKQDIPEMDIHKFMTAFREDIEELPPQPLQETSNVWAFMLSMGRFSMLVTIVKTAEKAQKPVAASV